MARSSPPESLHPPRGPDPVPAVPHLEVDRLDLQYGDFVIMRELSFSVHPGEILVVMGGSGCGKSTLLRHLVGLLHPVQGDIRYHGESFVQATASRRREMVRHFGVLYQGGALWSSLTLAENVALPLEEYTRLSNPTIRRVVGYKLALVGLSGYEDFYPSEISGGMRKRAALARAMALDPEVLFLDEPSAGLDPVSARRLDDLILELRANLKVTVVVVTHELASIFAIGDRAIFLDTQTQTLSAEGPPDHLLRSPPNENVRLFLSRGKPPASS